MLTTELERAAKALLEKLNELTSDEFACGGEREERRALHTELFRLGLMDFDADGNSRAAVQAAALAYLREKLGR